MTVVTGQTKRFAASSPVTRYWLANCVGFSVAGGGRGTVERLITDRDPCAPTELEIRHRNKLRRLPTSAVTEILPAEQRLVVRGADPSTARREALGRVTVAVGVLLLGLGTWLVGAGKKTVRLVRSLPWQRSARSVLSATTSLWREISTTWSRLRTTSSEQSSAKSSSERARTTSST